MKHRSFIKLCLSLGALLLGMPLSYSTARNDHYRKLHYEKAYYWGLNHINLRYRSYIVGFVYPTAMKVYDSKKSRTRYYFDPEPFPVSPKKALSILKKELRMSPQVYLRLTSGYLRENFVEEETKDFSNALASMISWFLQHEYYYKVVKDHILHNAKEDEEWGFITDWLKEEMRFSHLHTGDAYFTMHIDNFKPHYGEIYSHKNNFLKTKLLLWLTEKHHWPVPTDKQIKEGDIGLPLWPILTMKKRKIVAYKMKVIQLLQNDKGFYAKVFRFHIVNGQCIDKELSSPGLIKLRDNFFEANALQNKLLYLLSSLYWACIDMPAVIYTTGSLSLDIFCAPILAVATFPVWLTILWSTNLVLLCYFLYQNATLEETSDGKPIREILSEGWDKIKAYFHGE